MTVVKSGMSSFLKKEHRARTVFVIFNCCFLTVFMAAMLLPMLKVFVDSVDPTSSGIRLWPKKWSFSAYHMILTKSSLYRPFFVSIITTIIGCGTGLILTTLGAYVIIQKNMPGRKLMTNLILFTILFNGGLIPTYLTVRNLGLMNNLLAVIIPCSLNAYNIILMKSFFATIPQSLFEAAELDGCSPMKIFTKIVLPLSKPALASIGLFIAVKLWNEYMHFILYITDPKWKNFQVKIRDLILNDGISGATSTLSVSQEMLKSAVVIVVVFPFLLIYPFVQKYFTKGVTVGAVKG